MHEVGKICPLHLTALVWFFFHWGLVRAKVTHIPLSHLEDKIHCNCYSAIMLFVLVSLIEMATI
jgi:hypothetical protein